MKIRFCRLFLYIILMNLVPPGYSYYSSGAPNDLVSSKYAFSNSYYRFSGIKTDNKTGRQYWDLKMDGDVISLKSLKDVLVTITCKNTGSQYIMKMGRGVTLKENVISIFKPNDNDCFIKTVYNIYIKGIKLINGEKFSLEEDLCILGDIESAKKFGIMSKVYRIDYKNKIIKGVPPKTNVRTLIKGISCDKYKIVVCRNNGEILNFNKSLVTGDEIKFIIGGRVIYKFSIAVLGDLKGKGCISKKGIKICEKHVLGKVRLREPFLSAADLNGDGKVDSSDLILMKRSFPLPYE